MLYGRGDMGGQGREEVMRGGETMVFTVYIHMDYYDQIINKLSMV